MSLANIRQKAKLKPPIIVLYGPGGIGKTSFGATMNGVMSGNLTDVSVFSFHAVKNLSLIANGIYLFDLYEFALVCDHQKNIYSSYRYVISISKRVC